MENTITITKETKLFRKESGAIEIGERRFPCRGGNRLTYEVRLSASAADSLEEGDTLRWWDWDSDCPTRLVNGEIRKKDGTTIPLEGTRDVGIDTGHPPHLLKPQ